MKFNLPTLLRFTLYVLLFTLSAAYAFVSIQNFLTTTRGVSYLAPGSVRPAMQFGVNADLDQYNDTDLARALSLMRDTKVTLVRQHFYWKDIEPQPGQYNWDKWDRIVAGVKQNNLDLVAVIDTTPVWARDPGEADLPNASPKIPDDYVRFITAFVQHYPAIHFIQIWDNPNVHPYWGRRVVDPFEYTRLLRVATTAARVANPDVRIVSAGLAGNDELIRGHADYSDVLFLRGMYDAGAKNYFDIVGAKPYGMWSGPDDRRADKDVFNFSRAIVLHDEMVAHGDASKPMWAVEFGWNATPLQLPPSGTGGENQVKPSPWGSDTEEKQSARLFDATQRAASEWQPWMGALIAQTFQPNAPNDDPVWGFALVDKNFQPRVSYSALSRAIASSSNVAQATAAPQSASFDFTRFYLTLAALATIATVSAWRGFLVARQMAWNEYWQAIESRFTRLAELAQFAILALAVIAFYFSPNAILNFALLALVVFLFALRLDLGLAIAVFTIPFYLQTKNLIGGAQFSLIELLTLASVAGWMLKQVTSGKLKAISKNDLFDALRFKLFALDFGVLFFLFAGLLSVKVAANFGVANREFRVIVLEPRR